MGNFIPRTATDHAEDTEAIRDRDKASAVAKLVMSIVAIERGSREKGMDVGAM